MSKKYPITGKLEKQAIHVMEGVLGHDYVNYENINSGDKVPNHDGFLEIEDDSCKIIGQLFVQIRKIPKGKTKYYLSSDLLDFAINDCVGPFVLICVDVENKVVLWRHITNRIEIEGKRKSATITFGHQDIIQKRNRKKHIRQWISILQEHKEGTKKGLSRSRIVSKSLKVQHKAINSVGSEDTLYKGDYNVPSKYKNDMDKAKTLLDSDKHSSAKKIYEKILPKLSKDKKASKLDKFKLYTNLASCQLVLGDYKNAVINFKMAYKFMEKESELANKNMAIALSLEGNPEGGIKYADCALKIKDSIENLNFKAELLREAGKYDEAMKLYMEESEDDED